MKYEQKVSIHINKSNKLLAQNAKIKQENKTTKHKTQNILEKLVYFEIDVQLKEF